MNNFQEQGRACYKRGDYQKAIEFFDRALGRGASVQLLDNRAACYEKLNDLQTALKDAKKAIQLHREDPTGYLRAGKVLMKMEKEPVALEIYTHGLRCVKHVGQGYELLRKTQKDLMTKLSPPKSVDPFTLLPRELAEDILEYLSFKQRMNACLVSRPWAQFIQSCPDLWRHLDLRGARRGVRNAFISRAINIGRQKLTKATLTRLLDFDKALAAIVKHCPLEDLILLENGLQSSNVTQILASATRLKKLALPREFCFPASEVHHLFETLSQQLESFEYTTDGPGLRPNCYEISCPRLRTLSLVYSQNNDRVTSQFSNSISKRMPALESLTIRNVSLSANAFPPNIDLSQSLQLKSLDLRLPVRTSAFLKLPPTLVILRLSCTYGPSSSPNFWFKPGPSGLEPITFFLPCLEEVHLEVPNMIIHNAQHLLAENTDERSESAGALSKLRKLSIIGSRLNYLQISELFKHHRLSSLELLHLPRLESCCDDDVSGIMDCLPNLRSLDLSETDITGVGVRRAVESGHLEELIVNDCRKLGFDAVEWAREKGTRVKHRTSDGSNGGKKVRH